MGDSVIAPPPQRPYADEVGADPGRLHTGLLDHHPQGAALDPAVVAAVRAAAQQLEGLGHHVEPMNWVQNEIGLSMSAADHAGTLATAARFRRAVQQWWADGWDLLLTPTLAELPLAIGTLAPEPDDPMACLFRAGAFVPFTPAFNVSGQPAVSMPLHWTADGLPVGVQLVAAYGREDVLLQVAAQVEAAHPWAHRHPPSPAG